MYVYDICNASYFLFLKTIQENVPMVSLGQTHLHTPIQHMKALNVLIMVYATEVQENVSASINLQGLHAKEVLVNI